jgi:hypothetical protein
MLQGASFRANSSPQRFSGLQNAATAAPLQHLEAAIS